MISHCKNGHNRISNLRRKAWHMIAVLLKLSVQILICLRLEAPHWNLPAKAVLSPFWLLLPALAIDMEKLLIFILLLMCDFFIDANAIVTVTEVKAGHLAVLPCLSSDDNHRFMFWQLADDQGVIGPGNPLDQEKYNYEVLTGKLLIRGVSTKESGFYKCISKGILDHSSINVHVIELVVKKEWEETIENNFETNLLRGMAAVSVIFVGIAIVLLIITMKKKQRQRFFDLEDSSTRENSPARYNRESQIPTIAVGPSPLSSQGIDNAGLDVDFPRVFTQMQKEQALS
ncbi:hypothetical protein PV325_002890 [Microctonus aethiopoides]|nr:hypothetical protein PV325_002890 [Microctonus aethiopoides]